MTSSNFAQSETATTGSCPCSDCRCVECRCGGNGACQCPRERKQA